MTNQRANQRQIFSRPTIIVACHLLQYKGHSGLSRLMLEFGLEELDITGNLENRANHLARIALQMTDHLVESVEGSVSLHEAIVRAAVSVSPRARHADDWTRFHRGLERDGFSLEEDQETGRFEIRRMHPDVVDLVEAACIHPRPIQEIKSPGEPSGFIRR